MKSTPTDRTIALQKLAAGSAPALFVGPPGSGKTLAAKNIASRLGVDLRRVNLGRIVSRDIAETKNNIDALFDAAARDGAVLVLDEADALFGKRTEVRDAHDRYANIEVDYLLAKIEAHTGLAILTTNLRGKIDPAVVRRLGSVITFHPPPEPGK